MMSPRTARPASRFEVPSDSIPYKDGMHVFTPKSNYKPRLFRAPIAHLMCWLLRADDFATLRCWEDKIAESELNGPNFVTTLIRVKCDSKDEDDHSDHVTYCKGATPGTGKSKSG